MATESSNTELGKVELRREFGRAMTSSMEKFKTALSKSELKRPEKTELANAFAEDCNRLRQMFNAKNKRKLNRPTGAKNQGILMPGYFHQDIQNFFKAANMGPLRSFDYEFDNLPEKEPGSYKDSEGKSHHRRCTDDTGKVLYGPECSGRGRALKLSKDNTALMDSLVMLKEHGIASSTELATLFIVYARVNGLKEKGVYKADAHMEKHLGRVFDFLEGLPPVNGKRFSRKAFGQGEISKIPAFYALKNTENMPEAKLIEYGKKVGESPAIFKKSHGLSDKQVKFLYLDSVIKKEVVDRVAQEFKIVQLSNNCLGARSEPVRAAKVVPTTGAQAAPKAVSTAGPKAAPKPKTVTAPVVAAAVAGAVSSTSSSTSSSAPVAAPSTVVEPKPAAKPRAPAKTAVAAVAGTTAVKAPAKTAVKAT